MTLETTPTPIELTWARRLAPIIFAQIFLWLTFILFAFGPWRWPLKNTSELWLFICAAHVSLLLGYLSVAHKAPKPSLTIKFDAERLLKTSLWITIAMLPLTCYARTGHWIPEIVGSLRDSGKAYADAHEFTENSSNFASYIRIIASPWLVILFPLGFYFRRQLSTGYWLLLLASMVAVILMSIATGQRRDMADIMVTIPFIVAASHIAGKSRMKQKTIMAGLAVILVAIVAFTSYFTYSHVSRVGKQTAAYGANPATRMLPDLDNGILKLFPDEIQPGMLGLVNYLATGYYGLGLSMDRPNEPMYGMGHSMFITRNFERLINDESFETKSLPVQISEKDGFRYPVLWCTAYPYFANDLGFIGTVIMLFFIGRGLASTWIDMIGGKNPSAVIFFSLLMIFVFYLPATNRMLQDGEGVVSFYSWLVIYLASRFVLRPTKSPTPTLQLT
ncbi:MAG: O-antigen polymerase [Armatimonadota bacterium]